MIKYQAKQDGPWSGITFALVSISLALPIAISTFFSSPILNLAPTALYDPNKISACKKGVKYLANKPPTQKKTGNRNKWSETKNIIVVPNCVKWREHC